MLGISIALPFSGPHRESQAAATQREAADKSFKAYSLGEHSMTELIQNRRLAQEQQLASDRLLLDLVQTQALLALDAHRLWDLDD